MHIRPSEPPCKIPASPYKESFSLRFRVWGSSGLGVRVRGDCTAGVSNLALSVKITQKPYKMGSLGLKALK